MEMTAEEEKIINSLDDDIPETETNLILRVAEVAQAKGISTQDIADGAGVRYNTALAYVRNTATQVRLSVLNRIAYVLEVDPGELIVRVPVSAEPE